MSRGLKRYRERPTRAILVATSVILAIGLASVALLATPRRFRAEYVPTRNIGSEGEDVVLRLSKEDGKAIAIGGMSDDRLVLSGWEGHIPPGSRVYKIVLKALLSNCTQGFRFRLSIVADGLSATRVRPSRKGNSKRWASSLSRLEFNARMLESLVLTVEADGKAPVNKGWFDRIWIEVSYLGHWWSRDWRFRWPVRLEAQGSAEDLVDYQVLVEIDTESLIRMGRMKPDGSDIRLIDQDDVTELPYWIESGMGTKHTRIWVRTPLIPANGTRTIWLYHGNRHAGPRTSGADTFLFFTSFEKESALPLGEAFHRFEENPLSIKEYKGDGVVHPDVLYFPDRVDGYRFWMYYTPYPPDSAELPCLARSNDGIHFTDKGVRNPLIQPGAPGEWDDGLLADPDVVKVGDTWFLYYAGRPANKSWQRIGLAVSQDGKVFRKIDGNPVLWADTAHGHESHDFLMSPTVHHNATGFYMWYFSEGAEGNRTLVWMCGARSTDGIHWTKLPENPLMSPHPSSYDMKAIWHGDVIFHNGSFLLYYVANDGAEYHLCLARSSDGVNWTRSLQNPILAPVPGTWESMRIYRSSPVVVGDSVWLYYSAFDESFRCRIGLARSWDGLEAITPNLAGWDIVEGNARGSRLRPKDSEYALALVGARLYPKVRKRLPGPFEYSAWYYDDLDNNTRTLAILRLFDERSRFIGVGVYPAANATHYVYHDYPLSYAATSIARTRGWHRFSIRVGRSSCRMYVDGLQVAETAVLDEANLTYFGLEGYLDGTSYFDDVSVRNVSEQDPGSLVLPIHQRTGIG